MKDLLRSCFVVQPSDSLDLFAQNYHALVESGLGFDTPEDILIWKHVQDFFKSHGHVPSIQSLSSHFAAVQQVDCVDRLERLAMNKPRVRGDFLTHLEDKATDRRNRIAFDLAKDMAQIITDKIEIKDTRGNTTILRGAVDAVRYVLDKSADIVAPTLGGKLSGNPMHDGVDFLERYDRVKADPLYGIGQFCGVEQIDTALNGAKRHELWIHAGFTGSLNSTFALHWAYAQAIYFGFSSVYFSLEMPYLQCRNLLYTMHTAHEDFADIRRELGIPGLGLDYEKIKTGKLSPNEELFLRDYVVPSLNGKRTVPLTTYPDGTTSRDPVDYGSIYIEVPDPDKNDFTVIDMRARAEMIHSKTPFATIYVDHAGLMSARQRYTSTTDKLNEVIRDLKKTAMSFNRGMGIAVVALFQISREGFRAAEKNGGRYNLTHLSYANECLVAGTWTLTERGVVPIELVRPGDRVWSRSGFKEVRNFFDQGTRPTWMIENDRGEHIEATGNHRLRVLRDEQVAWARVDELQEGDWLLGSAGTYSWPSEAPPLPTLEIGPYEKPNGEQGVPITTPDVLTPDLAWLLGAWDGDGKVHPHGVAFTGDRLETAVRDRIRSTFERCFSHALGLQESPSRPGSFDLTKWSQPLKRWLEELGGPRGKVVPSAILRAPRHLVLQYLAGLWDTDGWVNNQGVVGLHMKSEEFLREVQQLMSMLGMDTCLETSFTKLAVTGKTYQGWTLRLRGAETVRRFQAEIGFTQPEKSALLESTFAETPKDKRVYPVGRLFAALAADHTPYAMLKAGRTTGGYHNSIRQARDVGTASHGVITTLLRIMDEGGIVDPRASLLRELVQMRVTQVTKVGATGRAVPVFDIEVDGDHEFQSGPFLSHNCERSADIVTSSWIDDDLRKMGQAIFQNLKSRDQKPFDRCPVKIEFYCRRFITDHTPIETLDQKLKDARGEDPGIKHSRQKPPDLSDA